MNAEDGWLHRHVSGPLLRVFAKQREDGSAWPHGGMVCFVVKRPEFVITPNEARRLMRYLELAIRKAESFQPEEEA